MSDLLTKKFTKLTLQDIGSADSSSFPKLSAEQQALASQWETLSSRFPESLGDLNEDLRSKTYVAGSVPSKSDLLVFKSVLPISKTWKVTEIAKYRHVLRWVDLVQNTLVELPSSEKVHIDYSIELPREVKEKKKPAAAAAAAAPAAEASKAPKAPKPDTTAAPVEGKEPLSEEAKKAKAEAQKAKKAAKAQAKAEQNAKQTAAVAPPSPAMIDFRVGFIQKAVKHPDADALYVSTIDMGDEEGPRTVCSGLVKYIPIEQMQERYVIVIANLKPVTMRGIKSCAMVLCASDEEKVEFVNPPPGSKAGDKIFFEGFNGVPEKQLNPKKKIWEAVQPGFSTNENFEVTFTEEGKKPVRLVNGKGELCKNSSIVKANVR